MESSLIVKIDGAQAEQAAKRLEQALTGVQKSGEDAASSTKKLGDNTTSTSGKMDKLKGSAQLAGAAISALAFGKVASKMLETSLQTEQLMGSLKTMTGSMENASMAFGHLTKFAAETPFTLDQSVNAFIRLTSLGLKPSEEALRSYGNTSSAMGKDMMQMIEAVADASTGEFERLKEFGIRARKQGDEIKLTFQGVTTSISNDAKSIQNYLMEIGNTNFAGAMADQMDRLPGLFSNLQDEVDGLFREFGDAGAIDALKNLTRWAIGFVKDLKGGVIELRLFVYAAMGGILKLVEDVSASWKLWQLGIKTDFAKVVNYVKDLWADMLTFIAKGMEKMPLMGKQTDALKAYIAEVNTSKTDLSEYDKEAAKVVATYEENWMAIDRNIDGMVDLAIEQKEASKSLEELSGYKERDVELTGKQSKKAQELIMDLKFELEAMKLTDRQREIQNNLRQAGVAATSAEGIEIAALTGKMYDQQKAAEKNAEALKAFNDETKKGTEQSEAWGEAMGQAVSRVDEAFANAWENIGSGFNEFADGLKDAFTRLLAELAHAAITKPIILNIAAALGIGGAGTANAAMEAAGNAGSIWSGFASAGSSAYNLATGGLPALNATGMGAYNWASQLNAPLAFGIQDYGSQAIQYFGGAGMNTGTNFIAGAGLNIGAGIAGGYVGNKVFGETSGIGSALGGMAGTYFGMGNPLFTAAGSFIGSGAERLLGNVFGFGGKGGNNAARGNFDLSTGQFSAAGIGNNFSERNLSTVEDLIGAIQAMSELVGGGDLAGTIKVGNTSGFKMDGVQYANAEELLDVTFKKIIRNSDDLSGDLKALILAFEGTAQETIDYAATMIQIDKVMAELKTPKYLRELIFAFEGSNEEITRFAGAIVSLDEMIRMNPVQDATRDFAEAQDAASTTLMDAYLKQGMEVSRLIDEYDGSLSATEDLAGAMSDAKNRAYDLALAIKQVGKAIDEMTADSTKFFEQSGMTDKELRDAKIAERKDLLGELKTSVDPARILELTSDINRLNREIYGMLSPEQQEAQRQKYIDLTDYVGQVADRQLKESTRILTETQDLMNVGVEKVLTDAANGFSGAARNMGTAVDSFAAVINRLQREGITVNTQTASRPASEPRITRTPSSVNI